MKPGDLIEVYGRPAQWATMYDENLSNLKHISRGKIGIVLEAAGGRGSSSAGYVKVLLSGNLIGFIYKDALKVIE